MIDNEILNCIANRKSVRKFTNQAVSKEQTITLVKAGMSAPSAKNQQVWTFVAITDRNTLDNLAEKLPYAKMLKTATLAIVVCGDMSKLSNPEIEINWIMDCSAATENILLAAEAIGLGAVWTAAYPYKDRIESVCTTLNMPENLIPLSVVPIGYSNDDSPVKDKWNENHLHWEKW